jgi:hypothetical protein
MDEGSASEKVFLSAHVERDVARGADERLHARVLLDEGAHDVALVVAEVLAARVRQTERDLGQRTGLTSESRACLITHA